MMDAMVYRYFYDCEFIEDGRTIDLVSIGVVDEFGREFYAISTEFDDRAAVPWVRRNVLDRLPSPGDPAWRSRSRIREDLQDFLLAPVRERPGTQLELWAWYAAYDHVALAQLWGPMPALPREIPRFTKDLRQLWDDRGRPLLPDSVEQRHDALVDARHNLARWSVLSAGNGSARAGAGDSAAPG
jgi:3' exoribonuclease, RNase T-like